jgi:hypothetical protein
MMGDMRDQLSIDLANEIAALLEAKADIGQAQSPLFERFAGTTCSSDSPPACMLVL